MDKIVRYFSRIRGGVGMLRPALSCLALDMVAGEPTPPRFFSNFDHSIESFFAGILPGSLLLLHIMIRRTNLLYGRLPRRVCI